MGGGGWRLMGGGRWRNVGGGGGWGRRVGEAGGGEEGYGRGGGCLGGVHCTGAQRTSVSIGGIQYSVCCAFLIYYIMS